MSGYDQEFYSKILEKYGDDGYITETLIQDEPKIFRHIKVDHIKNYFKINLDHLIYSFCNTPEVFSRTMELVNFTLESEFYEYFTSLSEYIFLTKEEIIKLTLQEFNMIPDHTENMQTNLKLFQSKFLKSN